MGGEGLSSSIEEAIVVQTMSYLDYDEWLLGGLSLDMIVVNSWGKDGFSGFPDKQHTLTTIRKRGGKRGGRGRGR